MLIRADVGAVGEEVRLGLRAFPVANITCIAIHPSGPVITGA